VVDIQANAFLLHMVRNIVGTLTAVGSGRQPPGWTAEIFAGRDRKRAAAIPSRLQGHRRLLEVFLAATVA